MEVLELVTRPTVLMSVFAFALVQLYRSLDAKSKTPLGVPWIGMDSRKVFAETRAHFSSFSNTKAWLHEGYLKYSKQGKSYILPDFSGKPELLVPRSQIAWLLDQPDEVLSSAAFHYETLQGDYAFTRSKILQDPYHEHVIHKYLPRRLPLLIPDLWDEVKGGFDDSWGTDVHSWKEIPVYDSVMFMISRAVNRMMVGLPLCRNEDYLKNMRSFAMDVINTGVILRFTPRWLRPIVGPLAALPNKMHYRNSAKYTVPLIIERLEKFKQKGQDPHYKWEAPNDFLSWFIMLAISEGREDELTIDSISRRLMPIGFASIHTTTIAITNCLLDLVSSDPRLQYLEGVREEAAAILGEGDGKWTKASLARCNRADSAMRESMRVSNFMSRNILRKVMPEQGIDNVDQGWHAPQGTFIGVDMHGIQHDADIYPDPNTYDAFRFSRSKEGSGDSEDDDIADGKTNSRIGHLEQKNTGLVTTSDTFLSFSHGRHACPGRYLIAVEVKMMLAYMTMNYDIEPLATRPANQWFSGTSVPPATAKIRIRRKEGTLKL